MFLLRADMQCVLSVCLSVCLTKASTVAKRWICRHSFWRSGRGIILVFSNPTAVTKLQTKPPPPQRGALNTTAVG